MNVVFRFQDVAETMNDEVPALDHIVFEKIIKEETTKGVWDKLKNLYGGNEKLKSVKLQMVEVLQASLEAHEMRLEKRNSVREKVVEQAMQARFTKMFGKEKLKLRKNHANDDKSRKNSKNHFDSIKKVMGNKYSGKKVDVKEV
ncbi:hypothetical protein KIW84_021149 [Lathyrus oleraceus]|uniref:Uncharacterized protein n=1 Tax=Pisum sativum TaxID=3888 RepID=A0A9D4Y9C5_PEA|nr:hypothetical protein KIW84_021149 [Pisum sativum]